MKRLSDFPLRTELDCADKCPDCDGDLVATITYVDKVAQMGDVFWRCKKCERSNDDRCGWTFKKIPFTFKGKQYYPLASRANIGLCVNCEKLIIGVPLIVFLDEGRKGELDFCDKCAEELGIFGKGSV